MDKSILDEGIPLETLLKKAKAEIEKAKEAQRNGEQLPKLPLISLLLIDGVHGQLPQEISQELGFLLMGYFKSKRGRPSTESDDVALAKNYIKLREKGLKDREAITALAKDRKHTDERSTRRSLARGKKLYESLEADWSPDTSSTTTGNALTSVCAVMGIDDKKD